MINSEEVGVVHWAGNPRCRSLWLFLRMVLRHTLDENPPDVVGPPFTVPADLVVLSCSDISTANILLASVAPITADSSEAFVRGILPVNVILAFAFRAGV